MLKDILDFENSQNFEVTRLMVRSVDQDSPEELIEFVDMLMNRAQVLTEEYPNAMKYIKKVCGITEATILEEYIEDSVTDGVFDFFRLCGLLNLLHISNIGEKYE